VGRFLQVSGSAPLPNDCLAIEGRETELLAFLASL